MDTSQHEEHYIVHDVGVLVLNFVLNYVDELLILIMINAYLIATDANAEQSKDHELKELLKDGVL